MLMRPDFGQPGLTAALSTSTAFSPRPRSTIGYPAKRRMAEGQRSKFMTVYVAEIKGRGIAAFHTNNGSDAERLVRDRVFRDDFMVLATGGLPLWDGVTDIEVRLARPDEEVKWRASRATARLCGETQIEHWKPFRHPLQAIDLYDVGAPKDARQIAVAARIESTQNTSIPPCLSDMTAFRASSMR